MKRIFALSLILVLLVCAVACGEKAEPLSGTYVGLNGEEYRFTGKTLTVTGVIDGDIQTSVKYKYYITEEEEGETIVLTRTGYSYVGSDETVKENIRQLDNALAQMSADERTMKLSLKRGEQGIMMGKDFLMYKG